MAKKLTPQVDFPRVLKEISVNRNDPCEIIRELVSNSYDAKAKNIWYTPLKEDKGFIFWDDGEGLSMHDQHGVSAYESFFSIGKSTKLNRGESIGYTCQGSKLCFASEAVTVITKTKEEKNWRVFTVDNPKSNLNLDTDITPKESSTPWEELYERFPTPDQDVTDTLQYFSQDFFEKRFCTSGTLIIVKGLEFEKEDYLNHFLCEEEKSSYLVNYIRFSTRHGSVKRITANQGFTAQSIKLVGSEHYFVEFYVKTNNDWKLINPGYPYLDVPTHKKNDRPNSPLELARLSDGIFYSRNATSFKMLDAKYSVILAVDGNRRALDGYPELDRQRHKRSGMRLTDQRGVFLAANGVKVCAWPHLLSQMKKYSALADSSSARSHFILIIDGPFELTTSRNGVSGDKANKILSSHQFISKLQDILDAFATKDAVFDGLVKKVAKEVTNQSVDRQLKKLDATKEAIKTRERFTIIDFPGNSKEMFLSPQPGEEYLVGILYASLACVAEKNKDLWKKVLTFSTQGIDSIGCKQMEHNPFNAKNLVSIEYKYQFDSKAVFNHMLATVDYIVAWNVTLTDQETIRDSYECFGPVHEISDGVWEISDIQSKEGEPYDSKVTVIDLKKLICNTFKVKWSLPPK